MLLAVFLFMMAAPLVLLAQVTITGTVTGAGNNPLAGASVKLKNSSNVGVTTDASGKFSLELQGKKELLKFPLSGTNPNHFL